MQRRILILITDSNQLYIYNWSDIDRISNVYVSKISKQKWEGNIEKR